MSDQPNILLITDDQHRWDFFGDTGAAGPLRTPALDQLRRQGSTLTQAFSNCPICMPARFIWYHGLYPSQAAQRLMANGHDWPSHLSTMPSALRNAGYHTAVIGKIHSHGGLAHINLLDRQDEQHRRGFDHVFEVSGKSLATWRDCQWTEHLRRRGLLDDYRRDLVWRNPQLNGEERFAPSFLQPADHADGLIGDTAARWLQDYDQTKPFFLHASFCGPHFPLDPPEQYVQRHRWQDMPAPHGVTDPAQVRYWQRLRLLYVAMIEMIDDQVAHLLDVLDRRGLTRNTVVLFASDHGDMIGDLRHNHKCLPYDGSCRTPITVRYPGVVPAGARLDQMVESADLPCTLIELATGGDRAAELLPQTPGRSFWSYLLGRTPAHRDWAYAECDTWADKSAYPQGPRHRQSWRMCCERDWKFVFHHDGRQELYDRQHDPHEQHNVAADPQHAAQRDRLRDRLIQSMLHCVAPNTMPPRRPAPRVTLPADRLRAASV